MFFGDETMRCTMLALTGILAIVILSLLHRQRPMADFGRWFFTVVMVTNVALMLRLALLARPVNNDIVAGISMIVGMLVLAAGLTRLAGTPRNA